jgi:hypothetical protein
MDLQGQIPAGSPDFLQISEDGTQMTHAQDTITFDNLARHLKALSAAAPSTRPSAAPVNSLLGVDPISAADLRPIPVEIRWSQERVARRAPDASSTDWVKHAAKTWIDRCQAWVRRRPHGTVCQVTCMER